MGLVFVWDLVGKLFPTKWKFLINVSTPGKVAETILIITFVKLLFFRNRHNIKYIIPHKFHRRITNSVTHPRWSLFANIVSYKLILVSYFSIKALSKMFDGVLTTPLNYGPINTRILCSYNSLSEVSSWIAEYLRLIFQADFWAARASRICILGTRQLYAAFCQFRAFRI